jgi:hypothetical protein
MNTEEKDDLWDLLGRAKAPEPSPFFSRDVLRALREEEQEKPGFFFWLRRHWLATSVSTCTAAVAAVLAMTQLSPRQPDPVLLLAQQVSVSPDYQVISNLDELLETEHNSAWLEASIR